MSSSFQPHGLSPIRLLCPWTSPGQNTGVGNHFLLHGIVPIQGSNLSLPRCRRILYQLSHQGSPIKCVKSEKVKVSFSCVLLFVTPMGCSPPGSTVHWILQQEHWSGLPFPPPGGLPQPGIEPMSPAWQLDSLPLSSLGSPLAFS